MNKLQIEYVPIEDLRTYEGNAKIHTAEQIEQIKKSILEFGMNDPIAVWKDNVIIEGHGRLIACKELDMKELPVIRLDGLTDEQRRAYTLVHNKLTMNTGFDIEILEDELANIEMDMTDYGFAIQIEDIDQVIEQPEEPFAPELGERNDYVVLEITTEADWERAQRIFGLEQVQTSEDNPNIRRHGIGRVIQADWVLDLLEGVEPDAD